MRRNNNKNLIYSILLLILLSIGIGYAYLTSNLSITGATEIAANSWDIHFANLVVNPDSVSATTPASIDINDDTSITYTVKLNRPKDFYEFTVDVVNAGTLPGKVSISTLSGISSEAEDIVLYTVNYTNGNPVQIGDILNGGATKSIKVRVFYNDEIDIEDLPSTNINLTLTYTLDYVQSEEDEVDTHVLIQQLKTENSSCFTNYTGEVTDQVGETVTASNVYINKCADKRNIIFNNMCWQMIRTTETGGIKMIYNGDVVDGKCESTRGNHKGVVQSSSSSTEYLANDYIYGNSFTYDTTNNTFTLVDTFTEFWSYYTHENLIGKYTCKSTSNTTCTTLYVVNKYSNNTEGVLYPYHLGNTNYNLIGESAFNSIYNNTLAVVGYMYNKVYTDYYTNLLGEIDIKFGNSFSYNSNTGMYTLSGTTQNIYDWSTGYNQISNTHYTCFNAEGECDTLSYVFHTTTSSAYHMKLSDGKSINDILDEMLYSNDVNNYSSSSKIIIDEWYKQNLLSKTNMLEDTVYCNSRDMGNQSTNGWNPNGGDTTIEIQFKNYNLTSDLSCTNITDQFAVSNNKAKLTYPVSLVSSEEMYNLESNVLRQSSKAYWTLSPKYFIVTATNSFIIPDGNLDLTPPYFPYGLRPSITLASGNIITSGSGTEVDPWVIE